VPLAGHGLRPTALRQLAGRPQLKRDPLGGACATVDRLFASDRHAGAISPLVLVLVAACVISRPEFIEPKWGEAPPALPHEITEITWEVRTCLSVCRYDHLILSRSGRAWREFRTGQRVDSMFVAEIDSPAFLRLAKHLIERGFFNGRDEEGEHEPLATKSLVMSVATLCRRRARSAGGEAPPSALGAAIDSAGRSLKWMPCCRTIY